jgi:hypothetical protein
MISVSDPLCNGTGKIVHVACGGTGKIVKSYQCQICLGSGSTSVIVKKDVSCVESNVLLGFADIKVVALFHSEYDQGVTANVTATVESHVTPAIGGNILIFTYEDSVTTYFPPNEDLTVTVFFKDILYDDDVQCFADITSTEGDIHERIIACPNCNGSGVNDVDFTCEDCGGTGLVDCVDCDGTGMISVSDPLCNGTGKIASQVTCLTCGGAGFIMDWTKVSVLSIIIVGAVVGASAFLLKRRKK